MLTTKQIARMNLWMINNARPYDLAKFNYVNNSGSKEAIVNEMIKYQNPDGGFGNGFECDIIAPVSAAIPSAEAIFQAYDYNLDTKSEWFVKLLSYFENSIMNIPKYWEDAPKEALNYPHAPWWNYELCTTFSPNPCAVVASAFILYGTESQKELGCKIAKDCFRLLVSNDFCGDHDSLNILTLINKLMELNSSLITDEIISAMKRRITENVCFDSALWSEYKFQPLDFIDSPNSFWYDCVKQGIEENLEYWINNINEQGVWNPNFSWGIDSETSRQVTENWKGYIAVKRVRIFKNF